MYFTIAQLPYAVNIRVIRRKYAANKMIFHRSLKILYLALGHKSKRS